MIHCYLSGSNATRFSVYREENYDPNNHGSGTITEKIITAAEVFKMKELNSELLEECHNAAQIINNLYNSVRYGTEEIDQLNAHTWKQHLDSICAAIAKAEGQ